MRALRRRNPARERKGVSAELIQLRPPEGTAKERIIRAWRSYCEAENEDISIEEFVEQSIEALTIGELIDGFDLVVRKLIELDRLAAEIGDVVAREAAGSALEALLEVQQGCEERDELPLWLEPELLNRYFGLDEEMAE
jgi:uncharacterized protein (UPF0218 family)